MSLKKEILGFVVHGPIRIHHGNYIHMGRVGGIFQTLFFFASTSVINPGVFVGDGRTHFDG